MGTRSRGEGEEGPEVGERVSRFLAEEALEHPYRQRIVELLGELPGRNKKSLAEALGVDDSTISSHVRVLERCDVVETFQEGKQSEMFCFRAEDAELWTDEKATRIMFGRLEVPMVALYVAENPCARAAEIRDALDDRGINAIYRALKILREHGLVRSEQVGTAQLHMPTTTLCKWVKEVGENVPRVWKKEDADAGEGSIGDEDVSGDVDA